MSVDGILNINKPSGLTSFQVVARVRRATRIKRVGHGGALDPMATGVLPVCIGRGTRVAEFFLLSPKTYRAEVELGIVTDTFDAEGAVVQRSDPSFVGREDLLKILPSLMGWTEQTPPMYSAVRYQGKHLYELARAGIDVIRQPRMVHVTRLELLDFKSPRFTLEVDCGKGTYVRSLAHDLGQKLGCGATLKSLVRLRCSSFTLANAVSLSDFEDAVRRQDWLPLVHPLDSVLSSLQRVDVDQPTRLRIEQGQPVNLDPSSQAEVLRAYSPDNHFIAILRFEKDSGLWHPEKVFLETGPLG